MLDTAYCGYANFLIVILFLVVIILFLIVRLLFIVFITNFDIVFISVKVFNINIFGDLEIIITV